jgi:hypothetical protein
VADFDLPSLGIQGGDLGGGECLRVQQGGEHLDSGGFHPAGGAGTDGEADQPADRARQPAQGLVLVLAAPPGQHGVRFAQQHKLRPVRECPDGLERDGFRAVLDPPGQVRAAAGEPDPPVHGEEPAVGQVDDPRGERGFQLICQRVLPIVVAAGRGGDPPAGSGAHVRGDPDLRLGAPGRHPERLRELVVVKQLDRGAVHAGGLHPVPGRASTQLQVGAGRVQLEDPPQDLLAQQHAGLGQRRPGRGDGTGLHRHSRHPERPGQDHVIALIREQGTGDHAHRGHLRGQRPVQLVAVVCLRDRLGDHAVSQQRADQALPAQPAQQVLPEPGPGRDLRR